MRVLVLYESRRGFTLVAARAIRDELRTRGHQATAAPLGGVDAGTIAASDALIVGTWTTGKIIVGVGPPPAALRGVAALPDLEGRPAVVFCTFDVAPRGTLDALASALGRRGAKVVGRHAFKHRYLGGASRNLSEVGAAVDGSLRLFDEVLSVPGG